MSEASKPKKKGLPATTPTSPKNETVNSPSRVKKSKVSCIVQGIYYPRDIPTDAERSVILERGQCKFY
jgi:hypothetical protein